MSNPDFSVITDAQLLCICSCPSAGSLYLGLLYRDADTLLGAKRLD